MADNFSNPWGGQQESNSATNTMEELAKRMHQDYQQGLASSTFPDFDTLHSAPSQQSIILDPTIVDPWTGTPIATPRLSQSNGSINPITITNPFPEPISSSDPPTKVESPQEVEDVYTDTISIQICPQEKSIFGHVNYSITSLMHKTTVIRRYSDFLWLQDTLLKKYPFRIIPSLPPKKVGADTAFLEKRRRGLTRFLTIVSNHPVLRNDDILVVFLTAEQTIQGYKSSTTVNVDEEIMNLQITPEMLQMVPAGFNQTIQSFNPTLQAQLQDICNVCNCLERLVQQLSLANQELKLVSRLLRKSFLKSDCVFQCKDMSSLETQGEILEEGMQNMDSAIQDHQEQLSSHVLESIKLYRDILAGYQIMLGRRHTNLISLQIQQTQSRIVSNKNRLVELTTRNAQKEVERVMNLIDQVIAVN